jgi:hypothetical protein
MQERRRSPRQIKCLRGRVYFNKSRKSLPCLIRDIAYEGAPIIIVNPPDIPNEMELYVPKTRRLAHASVRWRHGEKFGLALSNVERCPGEYPLRHVPR